MPLFSTGMPLFFGKPPTMGAFDTGALGATEDVRTVGTTVGTASTGAGAGALTTGVSGAAFSFTSVSERAAFISDCMY